MPGNKRPRETHRSGSSGQAGVKKHVLLPVDDLLKLEAAVKEPYERVYILSQLVRQKPLFAVERFLKDLGDSFVYREFRDAISPEVAAAIRPHIDKLHGKATNCAQLLMILGRADPVPELLALLDEPKWEDKPIVLYELSRIADARVVGRLARLLREAPPTYFDAVGAQDDNGEKNGNNEPTFPPAYQRERAVRQALEAIARGRSATAVPELIELLGVDLARFGTSADRETLQRCVIAHLIELTGESLGAHAEAWRIWLRGHPGSGDRR